MKSAEEIREETAGVLGGAVAEVAKLAIKPELEPFTSALTAFTSTVTEKIDQLLSEVEKEGGLLERTTEELISVNSNSRKAGSELARSLAKLTATQTTLEETREILTSAREEQHAVVLQLRALTDDLFQAARSAGAQARDLVSIFERAGASARDVHLQNTELTTSVAELRSALNEHRSATTATVQAEIGLLAARGEEQVSELRQNHARLFALAIANLLLLGVVAVCAVVAWIKLR